MIYFMLMVDHDRQGKMIGTTCRAGVELEDKKVRKDSGKRFLERASALKRLLESLTFFPEDGTTNVFPCRSRPSHKIEIRNANVLTHEGPQAR